MYKRLSLRIFSFILHLSLFIYIGNTYSKNNLSDDEKFNLWVKGEIFATNVMLHVSSVELKEVKDLIGSNSVRVQLILPDERLHRVSKYGVESDVLLTERLYDLQRYCENLGIYIVLDIHRPEGGAEGGAGRLWTDPMLQERYVNLVSKIANFASRMSNVVGIDILNEPSPPGLYSSSAKSLKGSKQDWWSLADRTINRVRGLGVTLPLIVEVPDYAKPFRFKEWDKFEDNRIVYSFHMYYPFELTHQGVRGFKIDSSLSYPGLVNGVYVNRERLEEIMKPALDFQTKHQVPIFVGEFGINWHVDEYSRERYIKDLVDVYNNLGWSWAYHAYKIWDGWNPDSRLRSVLKRRVRGR